MIKKRIVPIIMLIGLTSFVVLESSPSMLKNILELAQNNPISRAFTSSAQTEDVKSKVEFAKRIQKPEFFSQKTSVKQKEIPSG